MSSAIAVVSLVLNTTATATQCMMKNIRKTLASPSTYPLLFTHNIQFSWLEKTRPQKIKIQNPSLNLSNNPHLLLQNLNYLTIMLLLLPQHPPRQPHRPRLSLQFKTVVVILLQIDLCLHHLSSSSVQTQPQIP